MGTKPHVDKGNKCFLEKHSLKPNHRNQKKSSMNYESIILNYQTQRKNEQETVSWIKNIESDQEKLCISQIRHTIPPYIWNTWRIERQKNARLPESRNRKAISQHNKGYIL